MAIVCDSCQAFANITTQNVLDYQVKYNIKHDKEGAEHEGHGQALKSHKKKKSNLQGQKGASESL